MRIVAIPLALATAVGLSGCVSPLPTGPTVLAVPGPNKTFAQFQAEDGGCRNYAQATIGPTSPSQAATQSGVGSAAVGTVLGAAAGALIGAAAGNPAAGAAIGAGSGLVVGAGAGSTNAAYSGAAVQREYDFAYIQCMVANGDNVQSYPTYAAGGSGPYADPPYPYAYPYLGYGYGYPAFFGGPVVGFGVGWGGWHGGWGGWHGGWGGWHGGWGGWHGGWGGGFHGGGPWRR
jgi:hypothetical protein